VAAVGKPPQSDKLALTEINFLNEEKQEFDREQAELEKAQLVQQLRLRESFGKAILIYFWVFSAFCAAVILLQGFHIRGFALETTPLTTLIGGTAASAFGLVSVVLTGLFNATTRNRQDKR
jgi:hypothetical protein